MDQEQENGSGKHIPSPIICYSFRAGWPRDLMKHQGMDRLTHRVTNLGLQ